MPRNKRKESSQAKVEFPYSELSKSLNEIRLLSIQPGKLGDEIHCALHHASLDGLSEYTALSYTWGDPRNEKSIILGDFQMEVTQNLFDAIQHLRHESATRVLWIDALCINQNDIAERGKQVLRMRDIYSQADIVEVWLGSGNEVEYAAMELVRRIGATIPDPEDIISKEWKKSYHENFWVHFQDVTPELLHALNSLYQRPWWTRIWVVQEVSLAKQTKAKVTCGKSSVRWLDLLVTAYAMEHCWIALNSILWQKFPDEPLDGFQLGIRLSQCRRVEETYRPFTILELLNQHRDCAATDPVDFLYGLLGLSGDGEKLGIVPDYAATPQKIYQDVVVKMVQATGSLDIICACRNERNFITLPSWVPDWSTDQIVPGICINQRYYGGDDFPGSPSIQVQKYHAAGTSTAEAQFSEHGLRLSTPGFSFGSIEALGIVDDGMKFEAVETFGISDENGKSGSDSEVFNNWFNLILDSPVWESIEKRYGSPQNVLDAFCRTLVANRSQKLMIPEEDSDTSLEESSLDDDPDNTSEPVEGPEESEAENEDSASLSNESPSPSNKMTILFSPAEMLSMTVESLRTCLEVSWGKRLAILDTGFIGIVPAECIVGNHVCVLKGCTLPLVVRQISEECYKMLGESYFHGVCEGELTDTKFERYEIFKFE